MSINKAFFTLSTNSQISIELHVQPILVPVLLTHKLVLIARVDCTIFDLESKSLIRINLVHYADHSSYLLWMNNSVVIQNYQDNIVLVFLTDLCFWKKVYLMSLKERNLH